MMTWFYTMQTNKIDELIEAAKPETKEVEKGFLFFKRREKQVSWDRFWDFLDEFGTDQSDYGYSARAFLDFDLILMDKERMIWDFCDQEISKTLTETRKSSIAVFDKSSADDVLIMLHSIEIKKSEIEEHLKDENLSPDDLSLMNEAIFAAYEKALEWFSLIDDDEIGILMYS